MRTVNPTTYSTTVAVPGAVVVDASKYSTFLINLQANCTGVTVSNPVAGASYTFVFKQDAVGGHSYVWPSPTVWTDTAPAVKSANYRTTVTFLFDGTNWNESARSGQALTDTATLSNKTLVAPTVTGGAVITGAVTATADADATVPLAAVGHSATQSGNLQEWRDYQGNVMASMSGAGDTLTFKNSTGATRATYGQSGVAYTTATGFPAGAISGSRSGLGVATVTVTGNLAISGGNLTGNVQAIYSASITATTGQSLSSGVNSLINLGTVSFDLSPGATMTGSRANAITIPVQGVYAVSGAVMFNSDTAQDRYVGLAVNGTGFWAALSEGQSTASSLSVGGGTFIGEFHAGDYIQLEIWTSDAIGTNAVRQCPRLTVTLLGTF